MNRASFENGIPLSSAFSDKIQTVKNETEGAVANLSDMLFGISKVPSPIYSRSLERKKNQAFCLLQIFFSGIRTT